jgi:cytochrome c
MKKSSLSLMGAALGMAVAMSGSSAYAAVDAAKATELAQKSGCLACHGVDKKILGPAYTEIAKKYKGNKDAETMLAKKIKDGSSGVWGPIPMPAHAGKVSDADIQTLVTWILATK